MKVKPVVDALDAARAETVLVHTGQHYDAAMSGVFLDELGLRAPDHHLGAGSGSAGQGRHAVGVKVEPHDVEAHGRSTCRHRQTDVALAEDRDAAGSRW